MYAALYAVEKELYHIYHVPFQEDIRPSTQPVLEHCVEPRQTMTGRESTESSTSNIGRETSARKEAKEALTGDEAFRGEKLQESFILEQQSKALTGEGPSVMFDNEVLREASKSEEAMEMIKETKERPTGNKPKETSTGEHGEQPSEKSTVKETKGTLTSEKPKKASPIEEPSETLAGDELREMLAGKKTNKKQVNIACIGRC